ncbi:MerR family transcriptional regulator [Thalassobacillus pellis]|uniref:MerR family transcriptional regulator n=1 Tax=Thalassobacillus pellis TaxID=748008 RepID=UPI0019609340|nr:MerR family transcriptional regulator [Thalassobacillus pellis]MBM7554419.1 DNA-binding transcriptional MerR regulator [Thalassobacillus pellis]
MRRIETITKLIEKTKQADERKSIRKKGTTIDYERTYTLADISKRMKRPRTTLQSWKDQFTEFLPTLGRGRNMRYEEEALEVFAMIEKMKEAGEPMERIREVLQSMVPTITIDDAANEMMPKPIVNTLLESYESFWKEVRLQNELLQEQNEAYRIQNEERKKEYEELKQQLHTLQQSSHTSHQQVIQRVGERDEQLMERMQTIMEERKKEGFWARLFSPKRETAREPEHS